ncbi:hypothetical protein O5D80_008317 [Batrachochytrium dendrobatidis]|nr:hypothetical protein O5D80_008317 [Batrachochytrium dendrobatidis]
MTSQLPPSLLRLFAPRPALPYMPALADPKTKTAPIYTSVSSFLPLCRMGHDPDYIATETMEDRKKRLAAEKAAKTAAALQEAIDAWDPHKDENATAEPYKTLFVSRLSFDTTEKTLKHEFEAFGEVKSVSIVKDLKTGKPRGYAFIEFEHERDMKIAYKDAEGLKIDGRRILVDVERGRTVPGWKPRRLGGGLGGTRNGLRPATTTTAESAAGPPSRNDYSSSGNGDFKDRDRDRGSYRQRDSRDTGRNDDSRNGSRYDDYRGGSRYDDRRGSRTNGPSDRYRDKDRDRDRSDSYRGDRDRSDRDRDRRRSRSPRRRDEGRESSRRY